MNWIKKGTETLIKDVFLRNIGVESLDDVNAWFKKSYADDYRIDRLDEAVKVAMQFKDQPVRIVGDYDADGVTSTSILYTALRAAGFSNVTCRIPKRFSEGFGINPKIIEEIESGLVITCDNGIAQLESIQLAKDKGLAVIILDHHEASVDENGAKLLPPADVVVDPNAIEGSADFNGYCGAGLCWRFTRKLLPEAKGLHQRLLCLAAIGTVADVMELREENYVIVRNGLKAMLNSTICPPGLYALISELNLSRNITAKDIGFKIGPVINAASRMNDEGAKSALEALCFAGAYIDAVPLAQALIATNELRKDEKKKGIKLVEEKIAEECLFGDVPLVVYVPQMREGIVGIIAGYLAEKYKSPSIVVTDTENGDLKGSARAVGNYNMKAELDACAELLGNYGGHVGAAGLSLKKENFEALREKLKENVRDFECESTQDVYYDLEVEAKDIPATIEELKKYAPFGQGNAEIVFKVNNFSATPRYGSYKKTIGADNSIIKIFSTNTTAIGFDMAERMKNILNATPEMLNLVGTLSENYFGSVPENQLEFSDYTLCKVGKVETPLAAQLRAMAMKVQES